MLVLGIDPGSNTTGYGLVDRVRGRYALVGAGVVRTDAKAPVPQRLRTIYEGLSAVLERDRPAVVAIESIFHHKSSESALRLGQARGVALLACAVAGLEVFEYNAMTIKKSVSGDGRADKDQLARVVRMLLGPGVAEGLPADATDALAIAMTHLAHARHIDAVGAR